MQLTADEEWAGQPYQLLASATGTASAFSAFAYADAMVPLIKDDLTDLFISASDVLPGALGKLDENGESSISLAVPPELLPKSGTMWVVAVVLSSGKAVQVTNPVEVVLP